jgi:hypothetical protein
MKLIPQWRHCWRMFSVQASAFIVVWVALPADQQSALVSLLGISPEAVPGILAALAIVGRMVDQPKVRE